MENLLSMPTRPFEVMIGKIVPYILVGYMQIGLILRGGAFSVSCADGGQPRVAARAALLFIAANLAMGITFSTSPKTSARRCKWRFSSFSPRILLSGFMFPFPRHAALGASLGEILPLTHFLRIVRGILLKGNGLRDVLPESGRSRCSRPWPWRSASNAIGKPWITHYRES